MPRRPAKIKWRTWKPKECCDERELLAKAQRRANIRGTRWYFCEQCHAFLSDRTRYWLKTAAALPTILRRSYREDAAMVLCGRCREVHACSAAVWIPNPDFPDVIQPVYTLTR